MNRYAFSRAQASYLASLKDSNGFASMNALARSASLTEAMPPVMQQSARGTCVAAAVVALVEYYEDCHHRLSVQFLTEAIRRVERSWVKRNIEALRANGRCDDSFETIYKPQLSQIRLVARENGNGSAALGQFIDLFESSLDERLREALGTLIRSAFRALEMDGICRHSLWPYAEAEARAALPLDALATFPPGSEADAKKHRIPAEQLYMLTSPNNVAEIKGFIAGANARRPMPVAAVLTHFEGLDGETFTLPHVETKDDVTYAVEPCLGEHGVLITGYEDDISAPGGGWFTFRNSWGEQWGRKGYGRVSYAYVTLFCREAGTILEDLADYMGDGYVNLRAGAPQIAVPGMAPRSASNLHLWIINGLVALVIFLATVIGVFAWVSTHMPPPRHRYRHDRPYHMPPRPRYITDEARPTTPTATSEPSATTPKAEASGTGTVATTEAPTATEPSEAPKKPETESTSVKTETTEPAETTEPVKPDEPVNPAATVKPDEPIKPSEPVKPSEADQPKEIKPPEEVKPPEVDSPPDFYVEGDPRWRLGEDL